MDKEFEEHIKNYKAVDMVENLIAYIENFPPSETHNENGSFISKRYLEILLKELQRLESIDNAKPSEALKFVDDLLKRYEGKTDYNIYITKDWLLEIKQALLKTQKQEEDIIHYKGTIANLRRDNALLKELNAEKKKVLEIIFEKRVDLCILTDCDNVNEYNKSLGNFRPVEDRLTYNEFELLKKYCGKEDRSE